MSIWAQARQLRARVALELRIARKEFILKQIKKVEGDSHKFWRVINGEFFQKRDPKITQVFEGSSYVVLEGAQAANELNSFFCQISGNLSSKFDKHYSYNKVTVPSHVCDKVPCISDRRTIEQ